MVVASLLLVAACTSNTGGESTSTSPQAQTTAAPAPSVATESTEVRQVPRVTNASTTTTSTTLASTTSMPEASVSGEGDELVCEFLDEWILTYEAWVDDPGPDNTDALSVASDRLLDLSATAETSELSASVRGMVAELDPDPELLAVSKELCDQVVVAP